jgi:hypothetical protein
MLHSTKVTLLTAVVLLGLCVPVVRPELTKQQATVPTSPELELLMEMAKACMNSPAPNSHICGDHAGL